MVGLLVVYVLSRESPGGGSRYSCSTAICQRPGNGSGRSKSRTEESVLEEDVGHFT